MKYLFSLLLILLCFSNTFGQAEFAFVTDKDSTVNVRAGASTKNRIIDQLPNGCLIFCFENQGNWTSIDYQKNEKNCAGFIYKDRYQLVADFPKFQAVSKSENAVTFKMDSLEVSLSESKFNPEKHRFTYQKESPTQLEFIDGKQYWGKDGGMPETQYGKISVKIGAKTITLPKEALEGLYEPSFHKVAVNYDAANDIIYIQSVNSDGAGGYVVIWKIEKGIYKERLIAYGF